ncbi:hypothetical protein [Hydrogenivirga sp. 128-5-R1-1]|uniref:hypothetical protein n=1 Tax=Hydrogenivirga sp. 128-5-R1-1 TaxID=392423 RepID=UPI00015F3790|nr:hypothetical protein [Hydrogenivirga sp. 128-5-R1-1]EDP76392.1 hypothetical protein HG1285_02258 [Hydrogenivirga sp. 128-5-R1-1]
MKILILVLVSLVFSQTLYNGLVNYKGQVIDCGHILGRYAHGGVPSIREDKNVKLCCSSLREILKNEGANALLIAHLNICRQLGR